MRIGGLYSRVRVPTRRLYSQPDMPSIFTRSIGTRRSASSPRTHASFSAFLTTQQNIINTSTGVYNLPTAASITIPTLVANAGVTDTIGNEYIITNTSPSSNVTITATSFVGYQGWISQASATSIVMTPGTVVDPSKDAFVIGNLRRLWMLAFVNEGSISRMRVGLRASVTAKAFPKETFAGKVTNLSPQLDSVTRAMIVRIELDNPALKLRPEMLASAMIEAHSILPYASDGSSSSNNSS